MINKCYKMKHRFFLRDGNANKVLSRIFEQAFLYILFFFCVLSSGQVHGQTKLITVKANEIKSDLSPTMWGVFFEDINMGADGGIYAELIKNRSF